MSALIFPIMAVAILAYAAIGGVFLAFSDFIMRSLSRTSGTGGVDAMQVINREVFRWVFMTLFLALVAVSLLISAYGLLHVSAPGGPAILAAGLIYLIGCFGVTAVFNVPMNRALGEMEAARQATQTYWRDTYLPRWTFWNSVRAIACGVSAGLLLLGLLWKMQAGMLTV